MKPLAALAKGICLFCAIFAAQAMAFADVAERTAPLPPAEVLLINSFHSGQFWEYNIIKRISEELENTETGFRIRLHCEYLDYERHPPGSLDNELVSLFAQKYAGVSLKAIIVTDNDALDFMLAHGNRLFPGVPVVFCGIADPPAELAERRAHYTGILENFSIHRILESIPLVHPEARHLAIICGDTTSARTALRQAAPELAAMKPGIAVRTLAALPAQAMQKALEELPRDTVLLNFGYYRTADGQSYSMKESLQQLRSWTDLPMYSLWSGQLGKGVLAGQCEFNEFHAVHAAHMVLSVLGGTPPDAIPLLHEPSPYLIYDHAVLTLYGISESDLPPDSVIINRPLSFYEQHRAALLPAMTIMLVLFGIILLLMYLLRVKQRSESLLRQEKAVLAQANALERRSQLERRMEAIGRMAGGITHDVNNILGGIAACAQLALPEIPRENPAYEDVLHILDATVRGKDLMKQIRMTDSTKTLDARSETPLVSKLIRECAETLQPQLPPHVSLNVRNACPEARIRAVSVEVHQVLLNLCLNAIQAMPDGGELTVSAGLYAVERHRSGDELAEGSYVRIDISDTGKGIPSGLMEFIFDPFFTTKQENGGSGLGLAQVHSLVQRNRGAVRVANRPCGGALFSVFLPHDFPSPERDDAGKATGTPLSETVSPVDSIPQPVENGFPTGQPRTAPPGGTAGEILVVDDDPGILYLLEKLLNQMRLSVVTAADAETALSLFEKGMHPALVITDQKLPGIQGIAFARLVRKRFPRMPIILCSSCSAMHDAQSCHMGADEDIQRFVKPFDPQRLKEAVDRALQPKTGRWIWRAF